MALDGMALYVALAAVAFVGLLWWCDAKLKRFVGTPQSCQAYVRALLLALRAARGLHQSYLQPVAMLDLRCGASDLQDGGRAFKGGGSVSKLARGPGEPAENERGLEAAAGESASYLAPPCGYQQAARQGNCGSATWTAHDPSLAPASGPARLALSPHLCSARTQGKKEGELQATQGKLDESTARVQQLEQYNKDLEEKKKELE